MRLSKSTKKIRVKNSNKKSSQEMQDDIFRKMPVSKKIKLTADLSAFSLKLNKLGQ